MQLNSQKFYQPFLQYACVNYKLLHQRMSLNCSRIVVHRSFSKPDVRKSKRLDLMNNKIRLIELLSFFRSSFYLKKNLHFLKKLQFLIMNFNCKSLEAFIRNSLFVINICSDSRKTKAETTFEARWHSTFLAILQNLLLFQSYFLSSLLGFHTFFAFLLRMSYGLITHKIFEKILGKIWAI